MEYFNLILVAMGLLGFLPLAITLYKKKRVQNILKTGLPAKASVYKIITPFRPPVDIVFFSFYAANHAEPFTGKLTTSRGKYQENDLLDIYYLPQNPKRNTMEGSWKSGGFIVFCVVIALFVLFAVYKIYRMYYFGEME
ncbi:MAG: DUF3592 domain-containing protein [Chitinophagaceae bacterium]